MVQAMKLCLYVGAIIGILLIAVLAVLVTM